VTVIVSFTQNIEIGAIVANNQVDLFKMQFLICLVFTACKFYQKLLWLEQVKG
jgi:hypothetical protein